MDRVTYEDEFLTEYADGSTECRFTSGEWEQMLSDPAFGYVCAFGHFLTDADHRFGGCLTCEHTDYDYDYYDDPLQEYVVSYRIDYDDGHPSDTGTVIVEAPNEYRASQLFFENNLHRYLMMDYADVANVSVTGASPK